MKVIPVALAADYATRNTTLATALKITRADDTVYGFTSNDVDVTIDGVNYLANPGVDATAIVIAANAAVGNLELKTLNDGTIFTTVDILSRRWKNAAFVIFRYNWAAPAHGIDIQLTGTLGEFKRQKNWIVSELRDLRQYLQQELGDASSKNCRARLGDARCRKDLTSFTYTGTITAVTSKQVLRDSSRSEDANWFDEGEFTWTSGDNDGLSAKIKSYADDGTFTLALAMIGDVQVGDTYVAVAGCRKRLTEDCLGKFDNVLNFVGEPHRQGINSLTRAPDISV